MYHHSNSNNSGFTLIELTIGMGVLTLVLATMFSALTQSISTKERAKSLTFAHQAMQLELMELQSLSWSEVEALSSTTLSLSANFPEVPLRNPSFTRSVTDPNAVTRNVTLTLSWEDREGRIHSRELSTQLVKGGLYDYQTQAY